VTNSGVEDLVKAAKRDQSKVCAILMKKLLTHVRIRINLR